MNSIFRRSLSLFVLLALFCQPGIFWGGNIRTAAIAEEAQSGKMAVRYAATANVTLKVRRGAGTNFGTRGSISQGSLIYIMELGTEWTRVFYNDADGYVQSKYLQNVRDYDPATGAIGDTPHRPQDIMNYTVGATDDFAPGFKAHAARGITLYTEQDPKSKFVIKVPTYKEVLVSHIEGDWAYAMYQKKKGWVTTEHLFKWDRINPYAGDIPGCIFYPTLAFTKRTASILDYDTHVAGKKKDVVHKTILPGSAVAVEAPDEMGRYKTPYWRTTGFITEEDIAYTIDVVPYQDAEPGDLISAMTTYYAVGVHTLQYQGRNWNIYLSTSMISGTVLQPNEVMNVNKIIGPYRKSTGYKPAPIASPTALWGYGGGTCQVNTTLYNAVIRLPIFVNHRKVHADVGIKYMLKGFDAAVGGGDINMIFTNTLPYPIRFNFLISDGVLTCLIFRAG